jgi:predicted nucleic acid-binding Zn ribbon protein
MRVFTATAVHFKGGGWTETTSQTKEKLAKLETTRRLAAMNDSD